MRRKGCVQRGGAYIRSKYWNKVPYKKKKKVGFHLTCGLRMGKMLLPTCRILGVRICPLYYAKNEMENWLAVTRICKQP